LALALIPTKDGGCGCQKGGKNLRLFKLSIILLIFAALISCAKRSEIEAPKADAIGNIEWKSSRAQISITISASYGYKLVGSKTIQSGAFTFDYTVFKSTTGGIIAIIDLKRSDRAYDIGTDLFEPGAQTNGLLKYEPFQFSIWTGVSKRSFDLFRSLGIEYPKCKVALNSGRINEEDPTTAVFVVFIEPWSCDYKDFENIIDDYNDIIFIW